MCMSQILQLANEGSHTLLYQLVLWREIGRWFVTDVLSPDLYIEMIL